MSIHFFVTTYYKLIATCGNSNTLRSSLIQATGRREKFHVRMIVGISVRIILKLDLHPIVLVEITGHL